MELPVGVWSGWGSLEFKKIRGTQLGVRGVEEKAIMKGS